MAVAKPANTSPMISASPVSWMRVPAGMFLTAGSAHTVLSPWLSSAPSAMSALMTTRRSRLKRSIEDGPWPKRISATEDSGTDTPEAVGTGKRADHGKVVLGLVVELDADRDLAVADRELGEIGVDVADRGDAQRLRKRGRRDAELGQPLQVGNDDHLGAVERGVRRDRAELAGRVHLALDLARLLVEHGALGAHHAERQLPLAAVVDEIGAQIRHAVELGEQDGLDVGLAALALRFVDQVGDDRGAPRLQRALRAGPADHVDVLDLRHLDGSAGWPRRSRRACPRAGCPAAVRARR